MTPHEPLRNNSLGVSNGGAVNASKATSTICLLAGVWLFISPWVYGAFTNATAWNCWIVGGFMILFAIIRIARPAYSTVLSWCNMILGIWTFFSPWIYGYVNTNTGRLVNSLCVGVIVFVFSLASARLGVKRPAVAPM